MFDLNRHGRISMRDRLSRDNVTNINILNRNRYRHYTYSVDESTVTDADDLIYQRCRMLSTESKDIAAIRSVNLADDLKVMYDPYLFEEYNPESILRHPLRRHTFDGLSVSPVFDECGRSDAVTSSFDFTYSSSEYIFSLLAGGSGYSSPNSDYLNGFSSTLNNGITNMKHNLKIRNSNFNWYQKRHLNSGVWGETCLISGSSSLVMITPITMIRFRHPIYVYF